MAKLMIYDRDDTALQNDLAVSYKKGYVVEVFENDSTKCSSNTPFVSLTITEMSVADAIKKYMSEWYQEIDYNVISADKSNDSWRLALYTTNSGASKAGAITSLFLDKISKFIAEWNGTNIALVGETIEFDIGVYKIVTSSRFWNCNSSLLSFSDHEYDTASGLHLVTVDYTNLLEYQLGRTADYSITSQVNVLNKENNSAQFYVHQDDVIDRFKKSLSNLSRTKICKRRYCLSSAGVDYIISNGRSRTIANESVISSYIIDKTLEA